jgi:hypothetical protein
MVAKSGRVLECKPCPATAAVTTAVKMIWASVSVDVGWRRIHAPTLRELKLVKLPKRPRAGAVLGLSQSPTPP